LNDSTEKNYKNGKCFSIAAEMALTTPPLKNSESAERKNPERENYSHKFFSEASHSIRKEIGT
jgi:hypothetical protein